MATIVLAEDNDDLREMYAMVFTREGYEVHAATQGQEALQFIEQFQPELLLLDLWMPILDGFQVLDALRSLREATDLRVIVLSNASDADSRFEAFGLGVVEFFDKTTDLTTLVERIKSIVPPSNSASIPCRHD